MMKFLKSESFLLLLGVIHMAFFTLRDSQLTMKPIILKSLFPFTGFYSSTPLKTIEPEHTSDPLCLSTQAKDIWSYISSTTLPIWLKIRDWWYDYTYPTSSSDVIMSNRWSYDIETKTKPKIDIAVSHIS
ncbi:unnamed protein product [Trichobilharzia regenti]|nr:unnamed protein product [Trichobilharzia regenti]